MKYIRYDLKERIILIYDIGCSKQVFTELECAVNAIVDYDLNNKNPIKLFMFFKPNRPETTTDNINYIWDITNYIENSPIPIYTYAGSFVGEASFIIFLAGHKRYILNDDNYVTYVSLYFPGIPKNILPNLITEKVLQSKLKQLKEQNDKIYEYLITHTNLGEDRIKDLRDNAKLLQIEGKEIFDCGCADAVHNVYTLKLTKQEVI